MKPYYQHDGITIYYGDCHEVLPTLPSDAVIVSDPPYGIGYVQGLNANDPNHSKFHGVAIIGDDVPFDPSHLLGFKRCLFFGANHFADRLPVREGRWLVWDKRCGITTNNFSDCEIAWARGTEGGNSDRMYRLLWDGFNKDSERGIPRVHPTQKPVSLMQWCLGFYGGGLVVDPYMGAGATLIAAKNLGRQAIGIELEEKYCEAAASRLSQSVMDFSS